MLKRKWSLIVLAFIFCFSSFASAAGQKSDIKGHWAEPLIAAWKSKGLINGYKDGTFKPDTPVSKSEWIKLINSSLGYTEQAEFTYKDVRKSDWFAGEVGKAVAAGYIGGDSAGVFMPSQSVTREQAAVMLQKALWLPSEEGASFLDNEEIDKASLGAVGALQKQGLIAGANGKFKPKSSLTRAEAVALLDRVVKADAIVFDKPGTIGPAAGQAYYPKSIVLNVSGIKLQNAQINGNLTVGSAVGDGDAFVDNVKVTGTTFVQGGGANSVHFKNTAMVTIVVDKQTGAVRIAVEGQSQIGTITLQSGANIESANTASVNTVSLSDKLPADSYVRLSGTYSTVNVLAQSIIVDIPDGSIEDLNIDDDAADSTIKLQKEASVLNMILNAAAQILGEGKVGNAVINAEGVEMDKAPDNVKLGQDVKGDVQITVGGQSRPASEPAVQSPVVVTPPSAPSDSTPPTLTAVSPSMVTVGQAVYATSNEAGTIYLVKDVIVHTSTTYLELAVQNGDGIKLSAQAATAVTFQTAGLAIGNWKLVAADGTGNTSSPAAITILAANGDGLAYRNYAIGYNSSIFIIFNKMIVNNMSDMDELKSRVSFSTDNGATFSSLQSGDQLYISSDTLFVVFENEFRGGGNILKVAANSLRDTNGNVLAADVMTPAISQGVNLSMISHTVLPVMIDVGDDLIFSVDRATMVYLVPQSTNGNQTVYDSTVTDGLGKAIDVSSDDVDKPLTLDTAGLQPGKYRLHAWNGESVSVEISVSPPLEYTQIAIYNRAPSEEDSVTITGLIEGDVIKVYSSPGSGLLGSGTVASGQTSVTIGNLTLNDVSGILFFTRTQAGKGESSEIGYGYSDANDPPVAIDNVTVALNGTTTSQTFSYPYSELATDSGESLRIVNAVSSDTDVATVTWNGEYGEVTISRGSATGTCTVTVTLKDSPGLLVDVIVTVTNN